MARVITKDHAEKIASKLRATVLSTSGVHDMMGVFHDGKLIASFGIRRGSERDKGHDHVQKEIKVNTRFAKDLAICTKSQAQWIELMKAKGWIV